MLIDVTVAKMGMGMTQATLAQWLVAIGTVVQRGDLLAEVETDKVNVVVEAPAAGILREHLVTAGADFDVPGVIARIESTP